MYHFLSLLLQTTLLNFNTFVLTHAVPLYNILIRLPHITITNSPVLLPHTHLITVLKYYPEVLKRENKINAEKELVNTSVHVVFFRLLELDRDET